MVAKRQSESWRKRLYVPNYQVGEAARYARVSPRTVVDWHKAGHRLTLSLRERRAALSYMQLIELAVVAAFRKAGVTLKSIQSTRDYISKQLECDFPFATFRFKADGRRLVMDYAQVEGEPGRGKLLRPDQDGQLAWEEILGRLSEFEYESDGIAVRWHVTGANSPVVIDPRVAFGAPNVSGTPTWILKDRWKSGETIEEIAGDFDLTETDVSKGLEFEGVKPNSERSEA